MRFYRFLCRLLLGRTSSCSLVDGAGSCPSSRHGYVKGCVQGWLSAQYHFRQPVCWWVCLCSHSAGCLAWDIPESEPEVCWVGPGLSGTTVDLLESSLSKYSLGQVPLGSFPPPPHATEPQCMLDFIPFVWGGAKVTAYANIWNYGDSEQHQRPTCLQDSKGSDWCQFLYLLEMAAHTLPGQQGQQPNLDFNSSLLCKECQAVISIKVCS